MGYDMSNAIHKTQGTLSTTELHVENKMHSYQSAISEVLKSDNKSRAGFLVATALNIL